MSEEIPGTNIETLIPPKLDYFYFAGRGANFFEPHATEFSLPNAVWLAEAAMLAYGDEAFVNRKINESDLGLTATFFGGTSTQCYVLHNNDFVIVTVRGTQLYKHGMGASLPHTFFEILTDVVLDAKVLPTQFDGFGEVHSGWLEGLNEISNELMTCLHKLRAENPARPIWFTGHSLGAAVATLAAARFGHAHGLYTIGSPGVGDERFLANYSVKSYRIINNNDIIAGFKIPIPRSPLFGLFRLPRFLQFSFKTYHAVGELRYIDQAGKLSVAPSISNQIEDKLLGMLSQGGQLARQFLRKHILGFPVDQFNDHAPIFYVQHLRNNAEARTQ